jgi:MtN3 and saliva related transmembrane protein
MNTIEIIGLAAGALTTGAFVPQVYKTYKNKSTADISLIMYLVLLMGIVIWLVYGTHIKSLAILMTNSVTGFLAFIIVCLKLKYK